MITEKQHEQLCGKYNLWVQYDVVKNMSYEDAEKFIVNLKTQFPVPEGWMDMEYVDPYNEIN